MDQLEGLTELLKHGGAAIVAALAIIAVLVLYRSLGKLQAELMGLVSAHTKALTSVEAVQIQVLNAMTKDEKTQEAAVRALAFSETAHSSLDKIGKTLENHAKEVGEKLSALSKPK